VTEVPPLRLTVFNPDTVRYETLSTPALPLSIRPDGEVTAIESEPGSGVGRELNPDGLWHNLPPDAVDGVSRAGRWARVSAPVWFLVPPILWLALRGAARNHRLRRENPQQWRQKNALRFLRRALRRAGNVEQQRAAVSAYLAMRFGAREGALSYDEVCRLLESGGAPLPANLRQCLHALFHETDLARFGRSGGGAPDRIDSSVLLRELAASEGRVEP